MSLHCVEGGSLADGKKIGQHEWVALLATLGLGNYVGFAGGTVPNVVGRGSIEHFDEG